MAQEDLFRGEGMNQWITGETRHIWDFAADIRKYEKTCFKGANTFDEAITHQWANKSILENYGRKQLQQH